MTYNPFSPALPGGYNRTKADQQVSRATMTGPRAHPERLRALAEAKRIPRVRVEPTSEEFRRALKHPNAMAFRPEGSVEWPFDRFTQRRIADGSIRVVEQADGRVERHAAQQRRANHKDPE